MEDETSRDSTLELHGEEHGATVTVSWDGADLCLRVEVWDSCPGAGGVETSTVGPGGVEALEEFARGILGRIDEARAGKRVTI